MTGAESMAPRELDLMRKKLAVLGVIVGLLAVTAFSKSAMFLTTMTIGRIAGFFTTSVAYDATTGGQPGGQVRAYQASGTLLIGDVVYFSANNTVAKSATLANYNAEAGVVIGGQSVSNRATIVAADVGTTAATNGQVVWVLKQGRTWVPNDAGGTVTFGTLMIPSTATAGKVAAMTTAIDTNHRAIGRIVVGGLASTTVLVDVNVK